MGGPHSFIFGSIVGLSLSCGLPKLKTLEHLGFWQYAKPRESISSGKSQCFLGIKQVAVDSPRPSVEFPKRR